MGGVCDFTQPSDHEIQSDYQCMGGEMNWIDIYLKPSFYYQGKKQKYYIVDQHCGLKDSTEWRPLIPLFSVTIQERQSMQSMGSGSLSHVFNNYGHTNLFIFIFN